MESGLSFFVVKAADELPVFGCPLLNFRFEKTRKKKDVGGVGKKLMRTVTGLRVFFNLWLLDIDYLKNKRCLMFFVSLKDIERLVNVVDSDTSFIIVNV